MSYNGIFAKYFSFARKQIQTAIRHVFKKFWIIWKWGKAYEEVFCIARDDFFMTWSPNRHVNARQTLWGIYLWIRAYKKIPFLTSTVQFMPQPVSCSHAWYSVLKSVAYRKLNKKGGWRGWFIVKASKKWAYILNFRLIWKLKKNSRQILGLGKN